MTRGSFTVETRGQAVAIFGGPEALTTRLIEELVSKGIHALKIFEKNDLEILRQTHDPDYLVVFGNSLDHELVSTLEPLIDSGESRLITVAHSSATTFITPMKPVSKKIFYSDYVGDSELASPTIEGWLKSIESHHSLIVPGDGLTEISLLALDDLARLLCLSILHPNTKIGETISLANPTPISLLNLAYLVRTGLSLKISLTFDPDQEIETFAFDREQIENYLAKLSYVLEGGEEASLKFYLKKYATDGNLKEAVPPLVKEPPKIEKRGVELPRKDNTEAVESNKFLSPLKRLTPLKAPQPFFVPLQERKVKKPFSLKLKFKFKRAVKHSGPPRLRTIVGRGLIIALALYLGTLAFSLTIAGLSLGRIYTNLKNDQLPMANKLNEFTVTYLRANWLVLTSFPGVSQKPTISDINLLLDAYTQALDAFRTAESLSRSAEDIASYIFGSGNADIAKVISLSRIQAEEFYNQLSLLDGSLPSEVPAIIPLRYNSYYSEAKTRLGKLKRSVTTTKALLATAPDVIGIGGRRKYAVLFQNNMELRATGGFIGSFAILSFENGKLYDMPIYDVYDADGQLKGHVEPPAAIKDILGEANWYLRDSNFDPDFPTSARRAEWFIKKSLNQDLDGTIAVNVNTLVSLLRAVGPIVVADYNETISGDNLYERAQFHAEVNFFPGSTQKKEFLSTVANSLFAALPTLGGNLGLKAVEALSNTVEEKDTLVSLTSQATEHIFQTFGWNGQVSDLPCPTSLTCHKDYAMVVDSNFGVNKANYFIKRNIEEVITFDKNLAVSHVLRVSYHNTSTSTAWPAGTYKNYQRLYLPVGSNITGITVGDKQLTSKEYAIASEHGKLVVSYLVLVPVNDKTEVVVEYSMPQLPQETELLYTWYWQKQPGTSSDDKVTVYLNYPMYLKPAVISPQSELAPQQLKFNMTNDTDRRVTVKFTK